MPASRLLCLLFFVGISLSSIPLLAQPDLLVFDRFRVEVDWKTPEMTTTERAHGGFLEDNLLYFHFFSPANVELLIRVLDGCNANDHFWVFSAGLTNVEVNLTVTDTQSGVSQSYFHPAGPKPFQPILDTKAFETCPRALPIPLENQPTPVSLKTLGLLNNRFDVTLSWEDASGELMDGAANVFTNSSGGFALSGPGGSLDAFVKILDGRLNNGSFWVYLSAMTNLPMTFTVTDTLSNISKEYQSTPGIPFSIIDHQFSKADTHRWIFPWISNNATFGSRLIANNYSSNTIEVTLVAIRADGTNQTVLRTIPGGGFLSESANSLFAGLGQGPGYAVIMSAPERGLAARWVTENLGTGSGGSPSQGVAIKYSGGDETEGSSNRRIGQSLMFGYLPRSADTVAAPVIVNVGNRNSNISLYFYDSNGNLLDIKGVPNLIPQRPFAAVLSDLLPGIEGDVSMIAHSDGQPLTGVVFTFNGLLEPSLGNAEAIPFVPAGTLPITPDL